MSGIYYIMRISVFTKSSANGTDQCANAAGGKGVLKSGIRFDSTIYFPQNIRYPSWLDAILIVTDRGYELTILVNIFHQKRFPWGLEIHWKKPKVYLKTKMINRYAREQEGHLKRKIFSETKMINRYAPARESHEKIKRFSETKKEN